MINRLPTPYDYNGLVHSNLSSPNCIEERDCMQEALTVEWLIEQGFMPEPTDFTLLAIWDTRVFWSPRFPGWFCEDMTR